MLKTSNNFYFIYEFCNGGTLESLLSKQGKLSEQSALLIFKQLLEAFQVLNKYNIMHRDLKPDNIFFHNGVIKLGDFGFRKLACSIYTLSSYNPTFCRYWTVSPFNNMLAYCFILDNLPSEPATWTNRTTSFCLQSKYIKIHPFYLFRLGNIVLLIKVTF